MRRTAAFLSAGLLGVVALLAGLAIDSYLHAKDPTLAHREGLFTLSNPGHVLLEIGHYVNPSYMVPADVLDPQHVQSLIYYNGKQGTVLIGAMFIMPNRAMDGPQIGGPLTVWHQHSNICFDDTSGMAVAFVHSDVFDGNEKSGSCPRGSTNKTTPLMLHVWLIDNPEGPFASTMAPEILGTTAPVA